MLDLSHYQRVTPEGGRCWVYRVEVCERCGGEMEGANPLQLVEPLSRVLRLAPHLLVSETRPPDGWYDEDFDGVVCDKCVGQPVEECERWCAPCGDHSVVVGCLSEWEYQLRLCVEETDSEVTSHSLDAEIERPRHDTFVGLYRRKVGGREWSWVADFNRDGTQRPEDN